MSHYKGHTVNILMQKTVEITEQMFDRVFSLLYNYYTIN